MREEREGKKKGAADMDNAIQKHKQHSETIKRPLIFQAQYQIAEVQCRWIIFGEHNYDVAHYDPHADH